MEQIKIITLNIEKDKHSKSVTSFIRREFPEILCNQEILEDEFEKIKNAFGYSGIFMPMCKIKDLEENIRTSGIALFSKLPIEKSDIFYYHKPSEEVQLYSNKTLEEKRNSIRQGVIVATIKKDDKEFTIANTHFTWTPDGMPNKYQETDILKLLEILSNFPELIICGDFNIPRDQNNLYGLLIEKFKDNTPRDISTTLDMSVHKTLSDPKEAARVGTYVVDYIFSTPKFNITDVKCEYHISDHAAVIGTLSV